MIRQRLDKAIDDALRAGFRKSASGDE